MAAVRRTFGLYEVTDIIDTGKNSRLLATLEIDPEALNLIDRIPQNA
jgi:hypothetical protein